MEKKRFEWSIIIKTWSRTTTPKHFWAHRKCSKPRPEFHLRRGYSAVLLLKQGHTCSVCIHRYANDDHFIHSLASLKILYAHRPKNVLLRFRKYQGLWHVFTLSGRIYTWIHLLKMIIPWWENLKKWRQYLCLYHSWIVALVFSMSMNSRHVLNDTCVICFSSFCNSDESRVYNKSFAGRVCVSVYTPTGLKLASNPTLEEQIDTLSVVTDERNRVGNFVLKGWSTAFPKMARERQVMP